MTSNAWRTRHYSVERISDCFLAVRNHKTSRTTVLMVRKEESSAIGSKGHLVFQQDGRGMYLMQAWFAGTSGHVETVARPKHDLEYAKGSSPAGSPIEVALK
jgi:hypothetical protein